MRGVGYTRGSNPFGQSFALQGAVFRSALRGGFNGVQVYGDVAPGSGAKFLAPIVESHCINYYIGNMPSGTGVPLNGFVNTIQGWLMKYGMGAMAGMPVLDRTLSVADFTVKNGVYVLQPVIAQGGAGGGGGGGRMLRQQ